MSRNLSTQEIDSLHPSVALQPEVRMESWGCFVVRPGAAVHAGIQRARALVPKLDTPVVVSSPASDTPLAG